MNLLLQKSIEISKKEQFQFLYTLFKIIASISTILTTFGFFFYSLGYCFLYGYYFSGDINEDVISIINLLRLPIPFKNFSVILVAGYLLISLTFLVFTVVEFKTKKIYNIIGSSLFFLIFHFCISVFFVDGTDLFGKFISFSIIWVVPIYIGILILWIYRSSQRSILSLAGILYGLIIDLLLYTTFHLPEGLNQIVAPLSCFFIGSLFTFLPLWWTSRASMRFIISLPFIMAGALAFLVGVQWSFTYKMNLNWYIFLTIVLVINIPVSFLIKGKGIETTKISSTSKRSLISFIEDFNKLDNAKKVIFVLLAVILLSTLPPFYSLIAGKYIRDFTPIENRKVQIIKDYDKNLELKGNVVVIDDGFYYISDENWRLRILKGEKIYINVDASDKNTK